MKKSKFLRSLTGAVAILGMVACAQQETPVTLLPGVYVPHTEAEVLALGLDADGNQGIAKSAKHQGLMVKSMTDKSGKQTIFQGQQMLKISKDMKQIIMVDERINQVVEITKGAKEGEVFDEANTSKESFVSEFKAAGVNQTIQAVKGDDGNYRIMAVPVAKVVAADENAEEVKSPESVEPSNKEVADSPEALKEAAKKELLSNFSSEEEKLATEAAKELNDKLAEQATKNDAKDSDANSEEKSAESKEVSDEAVVAAKKDVAPTASSQFITINVHSPQTILVSIYSETNLDGDLQPELISSTYLRVVYAKEFQQMAKDMDAARSKLQKVVEAKMAQKAAAVELVTKEEVIANPNVLDDSNRDASEDANADATKSDGDLNDKESVVIEEKIAAKTPANQELSAEQMMTDEEALMSESKNVDAAPETATAEKLGEAI